MHSIKTFEQNSTYNKGLLETWNICTLSDIGTVNDTYVNQGSAIYVHGYRWMWVWITFDVNDSTTNIVEFLHGTDTDNLTFTMETAGDYQKTIGDADITKIYKFDLEDCGKYIQFRSKASVVGATEGKLTINITLG